METNTQEVARRLDCIESILQDLVAQRTIQDWYGTEEVATILKRSPYTVREWCRERRIRAEKRLCGRGRSQEWMISHEELVRIQNEGLLPKRDVFGCQERSQRNRLGS